MLVSVLFGVATLNLAICSPLEWIVGNPLPAKSQLLMPVRLGDSKLRERRQAVARTQPIRILPVYAEDFVTNLQGRAALIQNEVIPKLFGFLRECLMVAPLSGPLLLNNRCTTSSIAYSNTGAFVCFDECAATTTCGSFLVPTEHLKQCLQCGGDGNTCGVGTPAQDGAGVSGYDYVLYITANQSTCPTSTAGSSTTVAFAASCQTEQDQDRPVAGFVNYCPDSVRDNDPEFIFIVTKHEVFHAMGFARLLMSLWRDPVTGMPRTQRNSVGLPNVTNGMFEVSTSTIDTVTYTDWLTASGRISHNVSRLVTPAVRREARDHFNCSTLAGVELENQGGPRTALSHWEKRVLGNEAMTGVFAFNAVFSRLTFAAFEDSGWYAVNYSIAEELIWGRGAGCRFAEGSCGEWIQTQTLNNESLSPFCNMPPTNPLRTSCTIDHEAVSRCNLRTFESIPAEYQYFSMPQSGGQEFADYCPYQEELAFTLADNSTRDTICSNSSNAPSNDQNFLLESFGPGSCCVMHGRQWTLNGQPFSVYGGGCYQYSCSEDAVTITIGSSDFVCGCSQTGQEMVVDLAMSGVIYHGSIVCPTCARICHASRNKTISNITSTATPTSSTATPSVDMTTPTPSVDTPTPSIDMTETTTPSVDTTTPSVGTTTPSTNTPTPSVDTITPSVDKSTPSTNTPTPLVDTPTPLVDMTTPSASTATPSTIMPTPSTNTPTPSKDTPSPSVDPTDTTAHTAPPSTASIIEAPVSIAIEPSCSGPLNFTCIANGQPFPDITWLWGSSNGSEIDLVVGSAVIDQVTFNVVNTVVSDAVESVLGVQNITCANYTVTCRATNQFGNDSAVAHVSLQDTVDQEDVVAASSIGRLIGIVVSAPVGCGAVIIAIALLYIYGVQRYKKMKLRSTTVPESRDVENVNVMKNKADSKSRGFNQQHHAPTFQHLSNQPTKDQKKRKRKALEEKFDNVSLHEDEENSL